jgi:hypothetical protein
LATKIVFGPIWRKRSLNDSSKPRIKAVMLTIEVMPMTTPRMVNAERSLLVRRVSTAIVRISWRRPARSPEEAMSASHLVGRHAWILTRHSRRSASIGSRLAARMAG